MVDEHLLPQRGVGGRFLSGTTPRFKHKGSKSTSAFLAEATGGRKRSASPGGLEETQSSSKKKKKARRIEGGESAVGAEEGEPKTPLVYLPFKHVEYYIQPAERYSDMSVLVQEANRRIPEILARSEQAATGTVLPAHIRLPPPSVQAPPPGLIPPVPANVPNPTLPTSTMGPASTQLLPTANTLPSLPPSTDTNPFLPFHNAPVPTSSKPLKRPTAKKKAPTGPTLAASRSTRHFLPWGVPPPRMLEFKSDFALDGECVLSSLIRLLILRSSTDILLSSILLAVHQDLDVAFGGEGGKTGTRSGGAERVRVGQAERCSSCGQLDDMIESEHGTLTSH